MFNVNVTNLTLQFDTEELYYEATSQIVIDWNNAQTVFINQFLYPPPPIF